MTEASGDAGISGSRNEQQEGEGGGEDEVWRAASRSRRDGTGRKAVVIDRLEARGGARGLAAAVVLLDYFANLAEEDQHRLVGG